MKTIRLFQALLGLVLVAAAIGKIQGAAEFTKALQSLKLSAVAVTTLLWLIPSVELVVGFNLILLPHAREALRVSVGLFGIFVIYQTLVMVSPAFQNAKCGCFGVAEVAGFDWPGWPLVRNVVFLAVAVLCFVRSKGTDALPTDSRAIQAPTLLPHDGVN